jgi:hypothetical protein
MRTITITLFITFFAATTGCGASVELQAPDDFVVLEDDSGPYEVRATSAHGVVIAARAVDNDPEGSLDFWVDAIKNRLRTMGGYALVEEKDVTARSGQTGKQLQFGRDESGHTYMYWIAVYVTVDKVYLVEAGGRQERFEEAQDAVTEAMTAVTLF